MKIIIGILLGILFLLKGGSSYVFSVTPLNDEPYVKILEVKEETYFGEIFEFVISVGTPDESPVKVSFYIKGLTEKKEIIFYGNNTSYVLTLPLELPEKWVGGAYELVVEGFGENARREVTIYPKNDACVILDDDFDLELSSLNESLINVSLMNKGDNSSFELWPEKYKASKLQKSYVSSGKRWDTKIVWENKSDVFKVSVRNILTGKLVSEELRVLDDWVNVDSKQSSVQIFSSPSSQASASGIYIFTFLLVLVCVYSFSIQKFK